MSIIPLPLAPTELLDFKAFEATPGFNAILLANAPLYNFVAVSEDFLHLLGMKKENVIGKGFFDLFAENSDAPHFIHAKNLSDSFALTIAHKRPHHMPVQQYDLKNEKRGAHDRYWKIYNAPIITNDGNVSYIIHSIRDVTTEVIGTAKNDVAELKNSMQQLQQQTVFMNSVLEASINGVVALDAIRDVSGQVVDFRIMKINKAFTTIIGLNESVLGKTYLSCFPASKKNGVFDFYRQVLETGQSARKEIYTNNRHLNSWFDVSVVKRDETGIVITFANISDQRKAAIQIEEQKNLLNNILKYSPNGTTVYSVIRNKEKMITDFQCIVANDAAERFTQIPNSERLSKTVLKVSPALKDSPLFKMAIATMESGQPSQTQYFHEGINKWLELFIVKMDEDHLINVFVDISPAKEAQERLEQSVKELKRSNEELEQFAYVASHDLQEPLRKIRYFNSLLSDEEKQEGKVQAFAEKVDHAAKRMTALIKGLLDYSQISKASPRYETVNLNAVLKNVLSDYELMIAQKSAAIQSDELATIEAIPLQMDQLFYNIIGNALKFTKKDVVPQITISSQTLSEEAKRHFPQLETHKDYVEITFSDNGIGFNQEYANKIFTIFQRLNESSLYGGYGIGMAVCKKIVEVHKGMIFAKGAPKKGASFIIILPFQQG